MRHKVIFCIICLLFSFIRLSSADEFLTVDDAGQLLYAEYSDGTTIKRDIVVFQKVIYKNNGTNLLECTPYHGNGSICYVKPKFGVCIKLNYLESELTPEIVAMELAYWNIRGGIEARKLSDGYRKLAEKMNTPVTNLILSFYKDLEKYNNAIKLDVAQYQAAKAKSNARSNKQASFRRNSCPYSPQNSSKNNNSGTLDMLLEKGLKDSLKNANAIRVIQNLAENQKNYFLAFCLYSKYWDISTAAIGNSGIGDEIKNELNEEIKQIGEEIREKYVQNRNYNQNREKSFKTVFPDRHGQWEYAPPSDLQDMNRAFVPSCYTAWRKTQTLSPRSEFPEWGNAMLEVLQMIRNPDWEKLFDTALSEYQKYNNN